NQTSIVTESYSDVEKTVRQENLTPLGVGDIEGISRIDRVNQAFNISRPKYYVEDREKAVYVAALAARRNASLVFREKKADRKFTDTSIRELQSIFIEEFRPNHVVVADLDSEKGVLAAYMAARKGMMPVDFETHGTDKTGHNSSIEEINMYNGVIKLDESIDKTFEKIGTNEKTVFEGKYVSLLSGPRRAHADPVDAGLVSDPADGSRFRSDLGYGTLDQDRFLEAAVGRYTEDVSEASLAFHNSVKRDSGKRAVVASEYLHTSWPVILATLGGGMRSGRTAEAVLEKEGFKVTPVVEYRSQPVIFLLDLLGMPTPMDDFVRTVDSKQKKLASYIGKGGAAALKNAAYIVRGLNYGEQTLEMYLEFRWSDWKPLNQEIRAPDGISRQDFRQLVFDILPERRKKLNESNLVAELKSKDIIYYTGIGDSHSWQLPNYTSGDYQGPELSPGEVPELETPIVWDNSDNAGLEDGQMKSAFMESGAANYIGFSSVNYDPYSSLAASDFFRYGETTGQAFLKAINSLRETRLVYSPTSLHLTGVGEKMAKSASLYGNPETPKDPLEEDRLETTKKCRKYLCELEVEIKTKPKTVETPTGKQLVFNTSDYLLIPGLPITPLYTYRVGLGNYTKILEKDIDDRYQTIDNVSMETLRTISHQGVSQNHSISVSTFPEKTSGLELGDELVYAQTALQKQGAEVRVLEEAKLNLKYRAPVTLDLVLEEKNLSAIVYSKTEQEAKLAISLGEENRIKKVEVPAGKKRLNLGKLEPGDHHVRAILYRKNRLAVAEEEFSVQPEARIHLFAPDIPVGSEREVRAIVVNPENETLETELGLETGGKTALGLLEKPERKVSIPPESHVSVSWAVLGIRKGVSRVKVQDSVSRSNVTPAASKNRSLTPEKLWKILQSPTATFSTTASSSRLKIEIENEKGRLTLTRSPEEYSEKLVTDEIKVSKRETAKISAATVETSEGFFRRKKRGGKVSVVREGLNQSQVSEKLRLLEREVEKIHQLSETQASTERKPNMTRNTE
ncbi:MAG: hypothetical protein ABEI58_02410, partial [Candidatus Nanohaloarchaea archaeon]